TPAAVSPAPVVRPPQPLARSSAPAPVTQAPPARVAPPAPITQAPQQAATPNYYVVTNYNGAQSLEAARGVVGDAYVRNFSGGTRIQMGAFSQASSAQNLVNQLQQQGIPAQVVTP
ncbi:SPOR domain-containing protein, partial [Nodosilinea sp. LEGE 07088]|uniref:SPOR domain-containing protein n=1 Tax=Nodosilinea sp. LEGE 07088 TaxID=2777968 RepID=UPI001D144CB7